MTIIIRIIHIFRSGYATNWNSFSKEILWNSAVKRYPEAKVGYMKKKIQWVSTKLRSNSRQCSDRSFEKWGGGKSLGYLLVNGRSFVNRWYWNYDKLVVFLQDIPSPPNGSRSLRSSFLIASSAFGCHTLNLFTFRLLQSPLVIH